VNQYKHKLGNTGGTKNANKKKKPLEGDRGGTRRVGTQKGNGWGGQKLRKSLGGGSKGECNFQRHGIGGGVN